MLRSLAARWPRLRPLLPAAVIAAGWPACTAGEGPLVAFLGDSLTSGWRLPEDEAYPALVGARPRRAGPAVRVLNAGVSGDTAAQGLARLPAVLKHRPDVLVVALGRERRPRRGIARRDGGRPRRIVLDAQAAGARVLLVGIRLGHRRRPRPASGTAGDAARAARLFEIQAAPRRRPPRPLRARPPRGRRGARPTSSSRTACTRTRPGSERLAENVLPPLELVLAEVEAGRR